ncbi:hypothetical protein C8Q74DRAFT_1219042 [Fomes fomentarius]|nr:hypothetical protein C8Q74DRAFT_1219042 [Fomes fomentarius]
MYSQFTRACFVVLLDGHRLPSTVAPVRNGRSDRTPAYNLGPPPLGIDHRVRDSRFATVLVSGRTAERETRHVAPDPAGPTRGSPELGKSDLQGSLRRHERSVWSSTTWNETDEDDTRNNTSKASEQLRAMMYGLDEAAWPTSPEVLPPQRPSPLEVGRDQYPPIPRTVHEPQSGLVGPRRERARLISIARQRPTEEEYDRCHNKGSTSNQPLEVEATWLLERSGGLILATDANAEENISAKLAMVRAAAEASRRGALIE